MVHGLNRRALAVLIVLLGAALFLIWQAGRPEKLVNEVDNRDLLHTIAAGAVQQALLLTPSPTAWYTSTPTRTPKPPTSTPYPTYGPSVEAGIKLIPAWTSTPIVASTVAPKELPPCATITPRPYEDILCLVD